MFFSKNTVSPRRVHELFDRLSAKNREHSAKFHSAEIKEKNIEPTQHKKIKRLPQMTAAEMISRLRMGKTITEQHQKNIELRHQNINQPDGTSVSSSRTRLQEPEYQELLHLQNRDVALNQIMHNLSNTRREVLKNIIKHNSSNDPIETMIKNKHLIDELTGNNLERPNLSYERKRKRVRKLERSRANSRVYERQRTHVR